MLLFTLTNIKKLAGVLSTSVLGTFVLSVIFILLTGCSSNTLEEIDQVNQPGTELPISTSINLSLQFSDSGNVKIIMSAPIMERFISSGDAPYDLMKEGINIKFIDSLGNVEAEVISKHAIYHPKKNILILSNDVRVFNKDGDKLNSEYLTWNSRTRKITSGDFVKITTADEIIYGNGFEANQDFTNYRINDIKGLISVEDEPVQ